MTHNISAIGGVSALHPQIREQMSGPDLHVFTLNFLALKQLFFFTFLWSKKDLKNFLIRKFYATFQWRRYSVFKKILNFFFDPQKVKKRASKVAHNRSRPFHFTVQPRPQPTAQNWYFILWNLGTRHLFSYLWSVSMYIYFEGMKKQK